MQEKSSVNQSLSLTGKIILLATNFIPLTLLTLCISMFWFPCFSHWSQALAASVTTLYLTPALLGRLAKLGCSGETQIQLDSPAFFFWWLSLQLQMVFNRIPLLEEILRFIPGIYSLWLRIWGSKIGKLTFWAPGTVILDRGFLNIGNNVVFGAGVRLNPHVIAKQDNELILSLALINIGNHATIGGYSLLTAGTVISANEATRSFLLSPPFSVWKDGKRVRNQDSD